MNGHLRRVPLFAVAAVIGVLAATGAAACGSSQTTGTTTAGQQAGAATSTGPGGSDAFRDCLRSHGVALPTDRPSRRPRPSGTPRPRPSGAQDAGPGGPGGPGPSGVPADCLSLRPSAAG